MKTTLLSFLILSILCFSCQSEYERQMSQGKTLIEKEIALRGRYDNSIQTNASMMELSKIKTDLDRCAHLSGNESLFESELNRYKSNLEENRVNPDRLITKYP